MKISLGMIARNEESTLGRCLDSVAPLVDEIIIGLAGESTDQTEAIARKYTDNVFDIDWKDDFSYARNLVLDRVTSEYFLWLDGDDIILGADKLKKYIESYPDVGAFHAGYDYAQDSNGNTVTYLIRERLVRMDLGWRWRGRVHEALVAETEHRSHLMEDVVVRHDLQAHERGTRNLQLLYKELEENEPNPPRRLLMYLGNENASRGNFQEALLHWRRYLAGSRWDEESYQISHKMADVYRAMGDYDRAEQQDFDSIKIAPHWPDAYLGLATTAYQRGRWQEVVEWTLAAGTKKAPETQLIINPRDYDFHPLYYLGLAYAKMGHYEEAADNLSRAYAISPSHDLAEVIVALNHEMEAVRVRKAFMTLYSHLGRHDEWLKARSLFSVAPKVIETHPEVQEAWWRTQQSTAHVDDPQIMVDFYVNNPSWQPMSDEKILDPEWLNYPRLKFARDVASRIKAEHILDLGCSDGFMSLPLARLGHRVIGVDLDPRCVSLAQSRAESWGVNADFQQGTIDDVPAGEDIPKWDLALAFEIIEHVVDVDDFLDRLETRSNHIAITTPYLAWEGGRLPNWDKVEPKGHLRIFDLNDMERHLSHRGRIHNLRVEEWGASGWIFADYEPGASWDKNITILTGATLEKWGPQKLKSEGLGGSETAVIKLGEGLAKLGHRTTVYGRIDSPGIYSGVSYRDNESFIPDVRSNMLIAWRAPEVADLSPTTDRLILWMHDTDAGDRLTEARARRFDQIVVLTEWHKSHMMKTYPFIPEEKYVVIGNGVDRGRFSGTVERNPKRVIYASSPDRGLDVILDSIWPRVTEAVPDAELHVYYGWNNFDIVAEAYPHLREFKSRVSGALLKNVNVINHGRVAQDVLAQEFMKSSIWLYPTYFPETYCITAVEAQLAGAIPVTNSLAALAETVKTGIIIEGDVRDPVVAKQYADAVIEILSYPENEEIEFRKSIAKAAPAQSWDEVADRWSSLTGD